jgi:hypothetical protein
MRDFVSEYRTELVAAANRRARRHRVARPTLALAAAACAVVLAFVVAGRNERDPEREARPATPTATPRVERPLAETPPDAFEVFRGPRLGSADRARLARRFFNQGVRPRWFGRVDARAGRLAFVADDRKVCMSLEVGGMPVSGSCGRLDLFRDGQNPLVGTTTINHRTVISGALYTGARDVRITTSRGNEYEVKLARGAFAIRTDGTLRAIRWIDAEGRRLVYGP